MFAGNPGPNIPPGHTSIGTLNTSVGTTLNTSVGTLNTSVGNLTTALTTPAEKAPATTSVVVAAGPTETALAVNSTFVLSLTVIAKLTNQSNIMFGTAGGLVIPIAPGQTISPPIAQGTKEDLNDWHINGTAGEGVYVIAQGA